jgi:hypothetical protein
VSKAIGQASLKPIVGCYLLTSNIRPNVPSCTAPIYEEVSGRHVVMDDAELVVQVVNGLLQVC